MTDADILLKDMTGDNEYEKDTISVLSVLCEAVTGTKVTREGDDDGKQKTRR